MQRGSLTTATPISHASTSNVQPPGGTIAFVVTPARVARSPWRRCGGPRRGHETATRSIGLDAEMTVAGGCLTDASFVAKGVAGISS
jgi:hypothetical protein